MPIARSNTPHTAMPPSVFTDDAEERRARHAIGKVRPNGSRCCVPDYLEAKHDTFRLCSSKECGSRGRRTAIGVCRKPQRTGVSSHVFRRPVRVPERGRAGRLRARGARGDERRVRGDATQRIENAVHANAESLPRAVGDAASKTKRRVRAGLEAGDHGWIPKIVQTMLPRVARQGCLAMTR